MRLKHWDEVDVLGSKALILSRLIVLFVDEAADEGGFEQIEPIFNFFL